MTILISNEYPRFYETIKNVGYDCIPTKKNELLDERTSSHADLHVLKINEEEIFILRNCSYNIHNHKIHKTEEVPSNIYPKDCLLNCLILGKKVFCFEKGIDARLCSYFIENNYNIINVKQGYTKCSVLKLNDRAIITADLGIANAAMQHDVEVLLIKEGYIDLNGYNFGFIGGSSFVVDKNVFFFGNLLLHPSANEIINFCSKYGFDCISLSEDKLIDIGGAVVL